MMGARPNLGEISSKMPLAAGIKTTDFVLEVSELWAREGMSWGNEKKTWGSAYVPDSQGRWSPLRCRPCPRVGWGQNSQTLKAC